MPSNKSRNCISAAFLFITFLDNFSQRNEYYLERLKGHSFLTKFCLCCLRQGLSRHTKSGRNEQEKMRANSERAIGEDDNDFIQTEH
jgi:hypothetical protein